MSKLAAVAVFLAAFIGGVSFLATRGRAEAPAGDPLGDARLSNLIATQKAIKGGLRDPDSVKWESATANDDGSVVCVAYRSRNGFGGMVRSVAVAVGDKVSDDAKRFEAECKRATVNMGAFL